MKSEGEYSGFLVTETAEGITFSVHVQPRASRNEIAGFSGSELKLRLTSPPVEGAANTLCREFLAKRLHVAKSDVRIISGEKSRHKIVSIHGVSRESLLALLNNPSRSSE